MKIVVGQVVRGSDFWARDDEIEDIWDAIESGCHLILTAPRRVGKTSIMHKILDEPKPNYIPIYVDTESADTENEFWQKLFHALLDEDFVKSLKTSAKLFINQLSKIRISKISTSGVEFSDGDTLDYKQAFKKLIKDLDSDQKLIIMIDEFAQTIENIINYETPKNAISLLKSHRELRQDTNFSDKVTIIYAGSIGLESVVAKIHSSKHINDLNRIKISPLSKNEAAQFVAQLFSGANVVATTNDIDYLLEKIEWLIPFYIQLITQEIKKLYRKSSMVDLMLIDQAINNALDNRNHFESWFSKLKTGLDKQDYLFAKGILNQMSEQYSLDSLTIFDIATKHKLEADDAKEVLRSLIYDGYINNNDSVKEYRFNSPILRMWWNKNVAN